MTAEELKTLTEAGRAEARTRLERLVAWLAPAWTEEQRAQTVDAALAPTAALPTDKA